MSIETYIQEARKRRELFWLKPDEMSQVELKAALERFTEQRDRFQELVNAFDDRVAQVSEEIKRRT